MFPLEILGAMSESQATHPMQAWAQSAGKTVRELAEAAGCSDSHIRNVFAGRKRVSLGLAQRLSNVTAGEVPMEAFVTREPEDVRQ